MSRNSMTSPTFLEPMADLSNSSPNDTAYLQSFGEDLELDSVVNYLVFSGNADFPNLLQDSPLGSIDVANYSAPDLDAFAGCSGLDPMDRCLDSFSPSCKLEEEDDYASGGEPDGTAGAKRRRRLRSAKQQELNRLAQQRYRQRKREKYVNLQSTVDLLAEKMNELEVLEKESNMLRGSNQELKKHLTTATRVAQEGQKSVGQKDQQLAASAAKILEQQTKLKEQELLLKEREDLLEAQAQRDQAQEKTSAAAGSGSEQELPEQIVLIVKNVLADLAHQGLVQGVASETLVQHIHRSITRCCMEITSPSKPSEPTPNAISVSCC